MPLLPELRYIVGMKFNTVIRTVIALLLCLLLPLQAGATLARATAMAHHVAHRAANHHDPAAHGQTDHGKAFSHQSVHAKAGCIDCAKCCLLAASAPPPVLTADFVPAVARASFLPQSAPAPAFLTDGPERPPRHSIA